MKFKIFAIAAILVLTVLLVQAQRPPAPANIQDTVWLIQGDRQMVLRTGYFDTDPQHNIVAVIIVPEAVTGTVVGAAWTYAMRYGADGLDVPNYERAVEIIMERHPTWKASLTSGYLIRYGQVDASLDRQDSALTPTPESTPES